MSLFVYEQEFAQWNSDTSVPDLILEVERLGDAASQIFRVIKEYDHNPSWDVDTLYALSLGGIAVLAGVDPVIREIERKLKRVEATEHQSASLAPGGIEAASQPHPGSLRAAIDAINAPDSEHGTKPRRSAPARAEA